MSLHLYSCLSPANVVRGFNSPPLSVGSLLLRVGYILQQNLAWDKGEVKFFLKSYNLFFSYFILPGLEKGNGACRISTEESWSYSFPSIQVGHMIPIAFAQTYMLWRSYFFWVAFWCPVGGWEPCWEAVTFPRQGHTFQPLSSSWVIGEQSSDGETFLETSVS